MSALGRALALLTVLTVLSNCYATVRIQSFFDGECSWNYEGPSHFADLSGKCYKVMKVDQDAILQKKGVKGVHVAGQTSSFYQGWYILKDYESDNCTGSSHNYYFPGYECLNEADQPASQRVLNLAHASISLSNVTGSEKLNNDSNIVYASASVYDDFECSNEPTPYPLRFVPGKCYSNVTEVLPREVALLNGATYPPVFPLTAMRITLSRTFVHFHSYVDPKCTILRHNSYTLSYTIGNCISLSRSSAVMVTVSAVEPTAYAMSVRANVSAALEEATLKEAAAEVPTESAGERAAMPSLMTTLCLALVLWLM